MLITNRLNNPHFTSDRYEEMQLAALRQQKEMERRRELERRQLERERQKQIERQQEIERQKLRAEIDNINENINKSLQYQGLSDPLCDNMAAFMLNFTCSILLDSGHDLREFFGSDEDAKNLQQSLTPECQKTGQKIRNNIMQLKISEDPIFGLITVNRLKEYMPEEGILADEQYTSIADNSKFACTTLIKKYDRSKFDDDDNDEIKALVEIVENTEGLEFGKDFELRLQKLINKHNAKNSSELANETVTGKSFIPPVEVRYLEQEREREREQEIE